MKSFALMTIAAIFGLANSASIPALRAAPVSDSSAWADSVTVEKVSLSPQRLADLEALAINSTHLATRQVGGCYFQAFSGNACTAPNGGAITITNSGQCIDCRNRHSFFISTGCPALTVNIYEQTGCIADSVNTREGNGCYNVNTGRNWQSSYVSR